MSASTIPIPSSALAWNAERTQSNNEQGSFPIGEAALLSFVTMELQMPGDCCKIGMVKFIKITPIRL